MLTKLDIINAMLATIGLASVAEMDTQHPAYAKASTTFDRVNKTFQSKPYWFNTSVVTLKHNPTTGEIILPSRATYANPVDRSLTYTMQGNRLYDRQNRTYDIREPVTVDLREFIDVELMPPTAQIYLQCLARLAYYTDRGGSEPKLSVYMRELQEAQVDFRKECLRNADPNWFSTHTGLTGRRGYKLNRAGVGEY